MIARRSADFFATRDKHEGGRAIHLVLLGSLTIAAHIDEIDAISLGSQFGDRRTIGTRTSAIRTKVNQIPIVRADI